MNTIGITLRLTTFGESHGPAMGGILDGMPPRVPIDLRQIAVQLERRRPGGGAVAVSSRREPDELLLLSGITPDGLTLGTPIGFIIENRDARPSDYDAYRGKLRPNHADYTYLKKYGLPQQSGGGRASARETVNVVAAGAIARQLLTPQGIGISAWISGAPGNMPAQVCAAPVDPAYIEELAKGAAASGDSFGARVSCRISGVPAGLGDPVYGKLQARLAMAMMSINAAKSFEYGLGREAASSYGSETADSFIKDAAGNITTASNYSGGIQGGISNGQDIEIAVAFKPTPTLMRGMPTLDIDGNQCTLPPRGRHDVCVALRAVPVVEAMASLVIADALISSGLPLKAQHPPYPSI